MTTEVLITNQEPNPATNLTKDQLECLADVYEILFAARRRRLAVQAKRQAEEEAGEEAATPALQEAES